MRQRDLEHVIRRWYREVVPEQTAAPRDLRARVAAIPDTTPQGGAIAGKGPLVLIAAVAVLSTLLLTFAIAGGTGLLRLPTALIEPSPSAAVRATPGVAPSPASPVALTVEDEPLGSYQFDCDRSIEDDVVLKMTPDDRASGATELVILDDGRVVTGSSRPMGFDDQWLQRRLTDAGLDAVLNAVAAASLPNCQGMYAGEGSPAYQLIARLGDGLLSVSSSDSGLRRATPEQHVALSALLDSLTNLDAWITPDQWAEGDWRPYLPDRWQLKIGIIGTNINPCAPALFTHEVSCRPSGHLLPDGSDLMSFGTYDDSGGSVPRRCGVVDRREAEAIVEALELTSSTADQFFSDGAYQRDLHVRPSPGDPRIPRTDDSFDLYLGLRGVLPHQAACVPYTAPVPVDAPPDALANLNPCGYVPQHDRAWLRRCGAPYYNSQTNGYWSSGLIEAQRGDLHVYLRVRPTTTEQADSYARSLFGEEGLTSEAIAGGTVYFNGCFESGSGCMPAVALTKEPYLLVVTLNWHESRDYLRSLAESIIREGIPAVDPAATP